MNAGSTNAIAAPFFNGSATAIAVGFFLQSSTNNGLTATSSSLPGVWTTGNNFDVTLFYEAA